MQGEGEWSGKTIDGRYRVERVLGRGGLGTVYRARHVGLDRPVAVKMLHPDLLPNLELRQRFEREVKTLSRLSHPHIVALTDSGLLEDGRGYLVMELLAGESLEDRIQKGALPPAEAIAITRQTLLALAEAHDKHVLHRDVKPGNVFLVPMAEGTHVKLLDFGLAKVRSDMATDPGAFPALTQAGTVVGTPTYMAPETVGSVGAIAASDLYALGIVLYEMLAGKPPFRHEDKLETIRAHLTAPVPELDATDPALHPTDALRAFVARVLEKQPSARFESARAMLKELDALPVPAATREPALPDRASSTTPDAPKKSAEATQALDSGEIELATTDASSVPPGGATLRDPAPPVAPPPTKSPRSAPPLWALVGLGVLGLGVAVGLGWIATQLGASPERPTPPPTPVAPPPAPDEDAIEPEADGESPFATPVPDELRPARREINRGRRLSDAQIATLEAWGSAHPGDSRAALLLARHYRIGSDWAEMVPRYREAYAADPAAIHFEPMLNDLVRAAETPEAGDAAADAIVELYGLRAAEVIDERRAEMDAGEGLARLTALRVRIAERPE